MAALLTGICGGVEIAHKSGIFHRDLKPENILLPASGTGPKVVDFGVAKMTSTGTGRWHHDVAAGTVVGTPSLHGAGTVARRSRWMRAPTSSAWV